MNLGKYHSAKKQEYEYTKEFEKCIIDTCQYCIDYTFGADEEKQRHPIMMLGKIQSGKTRAFTGLIALAFDNDFDMVFILTKNSKALVQQTESRMKKEFKPFILANEVEVKNIIRMSYNLTGYQMEKKLIFIAKKEKNNLNRLIKFIEEYSIKKNKKTIIIDDEADTTGIGYARSKDGDEYDLRTVASRVNDLRGSLDGCVFVQVTATPYALYLQPEFEEDDKPKPVKPKKTVLVPSGEGYIGGEYYFLESKDENHLARFLFEPVEDEEHAIVSDQKRKGKKSKIDDRRTFREEDILLREDKLPMFKRGIINFMIGAITLRDNNHRKEHYAYAIHTGTQKDLHISLKSIVDTLFSQIRLRDDSTTPIIERLLKHSYEDMQQSVNAYGFSMPTFETVKLRFYEAIDREYYRVDVVNSDNDIQDLLDEETGELSLTNPFSIFVGGQVLDRGVTISRMIGFYYGRNPQTMQQDTVLQHSRMFGYRTKELLSVTRFYTTRRIYSNMEKITEIDIELRNDIERGSLGSGVYFIAHKKEEEQHGQYGKIVPCSPDKIRVSDVIFLKPHSRIFPIGFTPINKQEAKRIDGVVSRKLQERSINEYSDGKPISLDAAEEIIHLAYSAITPDESSTRFITEEELIVTLRYMIGNRTELPVLIRTGRNLSKYRKVGNSLIYSNAPDTASSPGSLFNRAVKFANGTPVLMLIQQTGEADGWGGRPFWWPIIVASAQVNMTMYASKLPSERIKKVDDTGENEL